MNFMQQALEECASCTGENNKDIVDPWKGKVDPKENTDTGAVYDDGKGVKDTVMISGPLSHAYTQALLLTLKKEPLQAEEKEALDEETPNTQDPIERKDPMLQKDTTMKIGMATEGAQMDETANFLMIKEINANEADVDFVNGRYDFIESKDLPVNVVCNTTLISLVDFMRPHNIVGFTEDKNNAFIDNVVVVMDTNGRTANTTMRRNIVQIDSDEDGQQELVEFNLAVESHVAPAGYKVFLGLEAYFKYLRTLSKQLGN